MSAATIRDCLTQNRLTASATRLRLLPEPTPLGDRNVSICGRIDVMLRQRRTCSLVMLLTDGPKVAKSIVQSERQFDYAVASLSCIAKRMTCDAYAQTG